VAVGAVTVHRDRLLLVRRANPPERGRWSIPGGRVEAGETLAAALEREVLEETAIAVRCGRFLGWVERMTPTHHFVILDFEADAIGDPGEPRAGSDARAAAWVPLADVGALELVGGLATFLVEHDVIARRPNG
jgi:ADP-ribose pyrophosphatase YjhB (NUDIX family)